MIWPETIDVTSIPAIIGSIRRPDAVGLSPLTTWRNNGRYVTDPNSAKPTINPITTQITNVLFAKSLNGTTGSLAFLSAHMNPPTANTVSTMRPMMNGELHGNVIPPRSVTT